MEKRFKAIIFDLFNTLVYQTGERPLKELAGILLANLTLSNQELRHYFMTADCDNLRDLIQNFDGNNTIDIEYYENKISQIVHHVHLFEKTIETLQSLKEAGYALAVISNLAYPYMQPFYTLGLDTYIDHVIFSCKVGYQKPQREIYELAAELLQIPFSETLMVGDSLKNDVLKPCELGMQSILIDYYDRIEHDGKITCISELLSKHLV